MLCANRLFTPTMRDMGGRPPRRPNAIPSGLATSLLASAALAGEQSDSPENDDGENGQDESQAATLPKAKKARKKSEKKGLIST